MAKASTPAERCRLWPRLRRIWATAGTMVFVGLARWSLLAFRASGVAPSDCGATIDRGRQHALTVDAVLRTLTAAGMRTPVARPQ